MIGMIALTENIQSESIYILVGMNENKCIILDICFRIDLIIIILIQKNMPDKNEIERRKQIKRELREKARIEFEKNLPMNRETFQKLFDFLDDELIENECDDSLKLTNKFLENNSISNVLEIQEWLNDNGGYCDCEVLGNVEEMFDDNAIL